jgi:hypothetical protein
VPAAASPAAPKPPAAAEPQELDIAGPRKLIRPKLPPGTLRDRRFSHHDDPIMPWHAAAPHTQASHESSHAEAFYFQKQVQAQTQMVFVLDDGERIEGCIEWYDRNAIKVRCSSIRSGGIRNGDSTTRALIYKSSIKYLYKADESQP